MINDVGSKIAGTFGISMENVFPESEILVEGQDTNLTIDDPSGVAVQNEIAESVESYGRITASIVEVVSDKKFVETSRISNSLVWEATPGEMRQEPAQFTQHVPEIKDNVTPLISDLSAVVQVMVGYERNIEGEIDIRRKKWYTMSREDMETLSSMLSHPILCRTKNNIIENHSTGLHLLTIGEYFIVNPSAAGRLRDSGGLAGIPDSAEVRTGIPNTNFQSNQSPANPSLPGIV